MMPLYGSGRVLANIETTHFCLQVQCLINVVVTQTLCGLETLSVHTAWFSDEDFNNRVQWQSSVMQHFCQRSNIAAQAYFSHSCCCFVLSQSSAAGSFLKSIKSSATGLGFWILF